MQYRINIIPYTLHFKTPAGTSRGVYHNHNVWYVVLTDVADPLHIGVGECAPLPDLSCDAMDEGDYLFVLQQVCCKLEQKGVLDYDFLREYPSMLFGLETALMHYEKRSLAFWDTSFARGQQGITINGLIWMGEVNKMLEQLEEKLAQDYSCVKLKIGAIDFNEELKLLKAVRSRFSASEVILRVDANGAFAPQVTPDKLAHLSEFDIHSIEQPIRAGQWEEMGRLTATTPIPIALDEELIGINKLEDKMRLLQTIKPQFIILKPSLHGGWRGCQEWITLAQQYNIGWWITSALESNIGLNAIAQWCAYLGVTEPQGLGTGMLYTNNINLPLYIKADKLYFDNDVNVIQESLKTIVSGI